jgi:hypothetical protein
MHRLIRSDVIDRAILMRTTHKLDVTIHLPLGRIATTVEGDNSPLSLAQGRRWRLARVTAVFQSIIVAIDKVLTIPTLRITAGFSQSILGVTLNHVLNGLTTAMVPTLIFRYKLRLHGQTTLRGPTRVLP